MNRNELKRMKGEGVHLPYQLIFIQITKPPKVVTSTADVLVRFGYDDEAKKLRGW